jgi:hypothetical protein
MGGKEEEMRGGKGKGGGGGDAPVLPPYIPTLMYGQKTWINIKYINVMFSCLK